MTTTIYASFNDLADAEKATGALMDHGVPLSDITLIANDKYATTEHTGPGNKVAYNEATGYDTTTNRPIDLQDEGYASETYGATETEKNYYATRAYGNTGNDTTVYEENDPNSRDRDVAYAAGTEPIATPAYGATEPVGSTYYTDNRDVEEKENDPKTLKDHAAGLTTTTGADAGVGAAKGAGIGLGVGVLAGLAALFVPGVGLVYGAAAVATAIAGAAGAIGGGAIAGGVYGYLKDQGVPEDVATSYRDTVTAGGVILAVTFEDNIDRSELEAILSKYNALNVNRYGAASLR